jgi:hypothetical protein
MDLPSMITQLESALGSSFAEEKLVCVSFLLGKRFFQELMCFIRQSLNDVIEEIDGDLFDRYIKPRVQVVKTCLKGALSKKEIDWYTAPIPVGKNIC